MHNRELGAAILAPYIEKVRRYFYLQFWEIYKSYKIARVRFLSLDLTPRYSLKTVRD